MSAGDTSCICPLHTAVSLGKNDWQMGVLERPLPECDNPTGTMYWPNTHFHTYTHTHTHTHTHTMSHTHGTHSHIHTHVDHFHTPLFPVFVQDLQCIRSLYFSWKLESVLNCTWTRAAPCRSREKWLSKSFQKIQSCWHAAGRAAGEQTSTCQPEKSHAGQEGRHVYASGFIFTLTQCELVVKGGEPPIWVFSAHFIWIQ